jgi:hypothetical protein
MSSLLEPDTLLMRIEIISRRRFGPSVCYAAALPSFGKRCSAARWGVRRSRC